MVALGRFISKLGERGLPLFKLIKKTGCFNWMEEAYQAFWELKKYLTSPLVLVAPRNEEELLLYISATPQVVSTVLVGEREETEDGAKVTLPGEHAGSTAPYPGAVTPDPGAVTSDPDDIIPDPDVTILDPGVATSGPGTITPDPGAITPDPGTTPGASLTKPR